MPDLVKGHTFVSGEVVEAQSLNDLVGNAVIQPTLISEKVLKDPAAMSDRILIEDSGALKGITIQQIIDLVSPIIMGQAVPLGTVVDFAGPNAPTNWMFCYGQQLDRETFADLFAILGTTYGTSSAGTFGLPDYRSCTLVGKSDMGGTNNGLLGNVISGVTLGAFAGEERHIDSVNEMPTHTHTAAVTSMAPMHTTTAEGGGSQGLTASGSFTGRVYVSSGFETAVLSTPSIGIQGGSQPHNNLQPSRITNKIIKVLAP
jgi:microcystin-dependent protein